MITKNSFRLLVVIVYFIGALSLVIDMANPDPFVIKAKDVIAPLYILKSTNTLIFTIFSGFILIAQLGFAFSFFGFLVFWRPARKLFLISFVVWAIGVAGNGFPVVNSAYSQLLHELATLGAGIILGLIYFSPVKDYFVKEEKLSGEEHAT